MIDLKCFKLKAVGIVVFLLLQNIDMKDSGSSQQIGFNASGSPNASAKEMVFQPHCDTHLVDFVQITSTSLDAGEQNFEAFRVLGSGSIEWARWNSSGYLLSYAEPQPIDVKIFNKILKFKKLLPLLAPSLLGNDAKSPRVYNLEIADVSGGKVSVAETANMPSEVLVLIKEIKQTINVIKVQPGQYLWTIPYSAPLENIDIDLTQTNCDSPVSKALSQVAGTGRLIVRADDTIRSFVSEENAYRTAFIAKFALGQLLFGILSTN